MNKKNILVFPCGSEIGLEIHRSLKNSLHFNLIGGNSTDDHGKFVFNQYIDDIPFISSPNFISKLKEIVKIHHIDAIYPAMDAVITLLKEHEKELGCKVIASSVETVNICLSKTKTYKTLKHIIDVPEIYPKEEINRFPVFSKPDIGYGSRGAKLIKDKLMLQAHAAEYPNNIFCSFLPGPEYTIDCFTDRYGKLRYFAPRLRKRIMNGISVHTVPVPDTAAKFENIIRKINDTISFQGAWFVQLKEDENGTLFLLEVAARLGGSSSLFRNKGINFAMLTLFDAFGYDVEIIENQYYIELDRALNNRYKIDISYDEVFVDFDDCILLEKKYFNLDMMKFLFQCLNENIKITLLSKHKDDLNEQLARLKIEGLFTRIIHLKQNEQKSAYIDNPHAIFIDDSFAERKEVATKLGIPVFSLDMLECLLK